MGTNHKDPLGDLVEQLRTYQQSPITALKMLQPEIIYLAEEVLIDGEGQPNRDAIAMLRKHGFDVGPHATEKGDWLQGAIQTRNGLILFG